MAATADRFRLEHDGRLLELSARRDGLRTRVKLFVDRHLVGEASGVGRVLAPFPVATPAVARSAVVEPGAKALDETGNGSSPPTVLVLSVLPGTVSRALLLVPRLDSTHPDADPDEPDEAQSEDDVMPALPKGVAGLTGLAAAERHLFDPPPGSFAARLLVFQRNYPRLYASRHVVRAIGRVAAGLLALAVFVRLLLKPVLDWIADRLPDIDLPELAVPSWLRVILGTAKFWLPVLIAMGVATAEIRRRRAAAAREGDRDAHR